MAPDRLLDSLGELGTQAAFDGYADCVRDATSREYVLQAVCGYLEQWPRARVLRLQSMVGGWAPFDESQRPLPIETWDEMLAIGRDVEQQRRRFESAGIPITPELFEIDLCFVLAAHTSAQGEL